YHESGGFYPPGELGDRYELGEGKVIVNIGSVGQPRDGDTRASFATFDGKVVQFHRVAYDHESTVRKIRAIKELPGYLADRLLQGR
ncbi:MAG: metallophosphoesterase, partial [Planctomycetota bacterium]